VLVASAMGARRRYYGDFAARLAERGAAVLTFDYRGIGDSRPRSLRGFPARLEDWGARDVEGALGSLAERYPGRPLRVVTHSVGGQVLALAPSAARLDRVLFVASQSGYWRHWAGLAKAGIFLFWHVQVPVLTALFGYLPGPLWFGADVPFGVAREWSWWGRHPDYVLRDGGAVRRAAYRGLRFPLRAYAIERDGYAPERAVRALVAMYAGADSEVRVVGGRDVGRPRLGHFDVFRRGLGEPLWREMADWLLARGRVDSAT
jgi:predicted alpha/beta hydrolase